MNFDQRPLAKALVENPAQRSSDRVAYSFVIATRSRRQFVEGTFHRAAQSRRHSFGDR